MNNHLHIFVQKLIQNTVLKARGGDPEYERGGDACRKF